jgi:hypothetical protein
MLVDARPGVNDRHSIDDVTFHGAAGGGLVAVAEGTDDELVIVAPCGHGRCQRPRELVVLISQVRHVPHPAADFG